MFSSKKSVSNVTSLITGALAQSAPGVVIDRLVAGLGCLALALGGTFHCHPITHQTLETPSSLHTTVTTSSTTPLTRGVFAQTDPGQNVGSDRPGESLCSDCPWRGNSEPYRQL